MATWYSRDPTNPAAVRPNLGDNIQYKQNAELEVNSYAIYADGNYAFNESWKLTAGVRYSYDKKKGKEDDDKKPKAKRKTKKKSKKNDEETIDLLQDSPESSGSSSAGSFWLDNRICLSSCMTSSRARTDFSRPTNRGTIINGKTTMSRKVNTGYEALRGSSMLDPLILVAVCSLNNTCLPQKLFSRYI